MKKFLGGLFLIIALVLLVWKTEFIFTGNFIKNYFSGEFFIVHLIGLIFFFVSLMILMSKRNLDYLLIPDGSKKILYQRADSAIKDYEKRKEVKNVYIMKGRDSE